MRKTETNHTCKSHRAPDELHAAHWPHVIHWEETYAASTPVDGLAAPATLRDKLKQYKNQFRKKHPLIPEFVRTLSRPWRGEFIY